MKTAPRSWNYCRVCAAFLRNIYFVLAKRLLSPRCMHSHARTFTNISFDLAFLHVCQIRLTLTEAIIAEMWEIHFYVGQDLTGCQTEKDVCVTGWKISTSTQVRKAFICDLESIDTCVWMVPVNTNCFSYKIQVYQTKIIILPIIMPKTEYSNITVAVQRTGFHWQSESLKWLTQSIQSLFLYVVALFNLPWASLEAARWQQLWFAHFIKNASVRRAP